MDFRRTILLFVVSVLAGTTNGCQFTQDQVYGGTFADCTRRHLTGIPADLPANTTSLDLSNNNISALHFPKYVTAMDLEYLDISHNSLPVLKSGTFEHLHSLRELYLNSNNLALNNQSYPDDIFLPLQNLLKLHMEDNDQHDEGFYPENSFRSLRSVQELKIDTFRITYFGDGFSLLNMQRLVLGFIGCKLQQIRNTTFTNLRNLPLEVLDLDNCPIMSLEMASFLPLKNLKHLYMSNAHHLAPRTAMLAMYGLRGRNLTSIIMNKIFTISEFWNVKLTERILSDNVMVYLKDVCVEKISMTNNQILWVDSGIINKTVLSKCVRYIDMSMNDLYGDAKYFFFLSELPKLVSVNVSNHDRNKRTWDEHNVNTGVSAMAFGFTLPKTLQVLNMEGFSIRSSPVNVFRDIHIYNATSLRHASVANNRVNILDPKVTGVEKLTSLDMSRNNCSLMNRSFYDNFPNLESLNMIDVSFGEKYLRSYGERLFRSMTKLKTINLSHNNIKLLTPNIFSSNQMKEITLSYNRFESIPFDLTTTPNLHHLDLSFNSLALLSVTEMELLDDLASRNNLTLNLEGNILSCGCHMLDFILWLHNTDVDIIRVSSYICQMSDGSITNTSYIRDHYEEIWMSCNGRMSLSVTTALLSLFLLVIIVMYLTLKRKTLLVNMFLRMFGYGPILQPLKKTDFLNDAYMGYSDADYQYICHTVRDQLENRHGLKLFIRDRDTIPGGQIADDIISGIDSSWRIVLFLTTAFLGDEWCRFTINRVVYSSARMPARSILLMLFDDVNRGDIGPALLNVVEERNIFYVDRYIGGEDRMWADICERIEENVIN